MHTLLDGSTSSEFSSPRWFVAGGYRINSVPVFMVDADSYDAHPVMLDELNELLGKEIPERYRMLSDTVTARCYDEDDWWLSTNDNITQWVVDLDPWFGWYDFNGTNAERYYGGYGYDYYTGQLINQTHVVVTPAADDALFWPALLELIELCGDCDCPRTVSKLLPTHNLTVSSAAEARVERLASVTGRENGHCQSNIADFDFMSVAWLAYVMSEDAMLLPADITCNDPSNNASPFPWIEAAALVLVLTAILPLFVARMASDKESRAVRLCQVMGLSRARYIAWNFVSDVMLSLCILLAVLVMSAGFKLYPVRPLTLVMLAHFLFYCFAIIAIAYALVTLTSSRASAMRLAYLLSLGLPIVGVIVNVLSFALPLHEMPAYLYWIPTVAFARAMIAHGHRFNPDIYNPVLMATVIRRSLGWLALGTLLIVLISLAPAVFIAVRQLFRSKQKPRVQGLLSDRLEDDGGPLPLTPSPDNDDDDVKRIDGGASISDAESGMIDRSDAVMVVDSLHKSYGSRVVLDGLSFSMRKGECFGLLGVNGAGKSTAIGILTGQLRQDGGCATVGGYDTSTPASQSLIGVCAQFDIFFNDLTAREHVLFFARVKGIERKGEDEYVDQLLERVGLLNVRSLMADTLSGGQKRRLSLAIALTGSPAIVFLDEPSSALDPAATKFLWGILQEVKKDHAILLTSHNMQECDVLCDRVGILTDGALKTVAAPAKLKHELANHTRLKVQIENLELARPFLAKVMPKDATLLYLNEKTKTALYQLAKVLENKKKPQIAKLVARLHRSAKKNGIESFAIQSPTLEECFLKLI